MQKGWGYPLLVNELLAKKNFGWEVLVDRNAAGGQCVFNTGNVREGKDQKSGGPDGILDDMESNAFAGDTTEAEALAMLVSTYKKMEDIVGDKRKFQEAQLKLHRETELAEKRDKKKKKNDRAKPSCCVK